MTPIVFWAAIREFRNSFSDIRFWVAVAVLLALHLVAHGALLTHVEGWRFVWTLLLGVGETPLLASILLWRGFRWDVAPADD